MTTGEIIRVPGEVLFELGYLPLLPPVGKPHYLFGRGDHCEHTVEVPIRETVLWCPACRWEDGPKSLLKRIWVAPSQQQVWHSHWNWTTGREESDRRRMEEHMHRHSETISEDLGIAHKFVRSDPSDLIADRSAKGADRNGKTVESGWQSTHDRKVAAGQKPSKGKFVWG